MTDHPRKGPMVIPFPKPDEAVEGSPNWTPKELAALREREYARVNDPRAPSPVTRSVRRWREACDTLAKVTGYAFWVVAAVIAALVCGYGMR